MYGNAKLSERVAIMATIDPVSQGAGTVATGWIPMANVARLMASIGVGVMAAGSTVDAKLQQATDAAGTGAKDIAGKAITQLLAAGGNNRQVTIDLEGSETDVNNGFNFVRLSITVGTAASLLQAALLSAPDFLPASAFNQAGVAQQVG